MGLLIQYLSLITVVTGIQGAVIIEANNKPRSTRYAQIHPTPQEKLLLEDKAYWEKVGFEHLQKILKINQEELNREKVAKNVVIMIGDGMGIPTITAARIYKGQRSFGKSGEEHSLSFDNFPNVGLVKTYNVDKQVPDSAGTATALFTGVKTTYETLGLDVRSSTTYFDSNLYEESKIESIMTWAQNAQKYTGIITNTRITDATPAGTYAHTYNRYWECDSKIPEEAKHYLKDSARQLIEDAPGKNFKVILGGGYQQLGYTTKDETGNCIRTDNRNLTQTWLDTHNNTVFATKTHHLDQVTDETEHLLGLFHPNHLPVELVRDTSPDGTPSLTQMVKTGLKILQKSPNGYVLMIEGGNIDKAHHKNYARAALAETDEFDEAVSLVVNSTGPDTLIIVTADHSHTMALNGYGLRGDDILGFGVHTIYENPGPVLSYANGPGFNYHYKPGNESILGPWLDAREDGNRLNDPLYQQLATFYQEDESHGGEDVGIYARGPGSELVRGVMEQNFVAHLISYSACIGPRASDNPECKSVKAGVSKNSVAVSVVLIYFSFAIIGF